MIQSLTQLFARLSGYSPFEVAFELILIGLVVYLLLRFLRGTRGAGIIKGLALLLVFGTLAIRILGQGGERFQRINFLYDRTLAFMAIALLVVFQPELRRALMRLGETSIFKSSHSAAESVIEAVVDACGYLSSRKYGALIAIERTVGLRSLVEGGVSINADISSRLLQSIFWPKSALHDLGVIISDDRIVAANVQFPMVEAEEFTGYHDLGSRHRAALCLSHDSDCIAIVVSEERGTISIAERGRLFRNLTPEKLRLLLKHGLHSSEPLDNTTNNNSTNNSETPATSDVIIESHQVNTGGLPDTENGGKAHKTKTNQVAGAVIAGAAGGAGTVAASSPHTKYQRIESIIMVIVVTVLIWLYAEGHNLAEPFETDITISITSPDEYIIARQVMPKSFHIELEGPRQRIDDVKQDLASGTLKLPVGFYGIPGRSGSHVLPIMNILMQHPVFRQRGVSIRSIDPPMLNISIDRWVSLGMLPIQSGKLENIEVVGVPTFNPQSVEVFVAESIIDNLTPDRYRVVAEPNQNELANLTDGEVHTIDARLTFPAVADLSLVKFAELTSEITFSIKSKRKEISRSNVPIKIAKLPDDEQEYIVILEMKYIPEVKLVGPSDIITRIASGEIAIVGYIDFRSEDLALGIKTATVKFPNLPDSVTVVSGPHVVKVTINKRQTP